MAKTKKKIASLALSSVLLAAGGIALANGSSLSASAEEGISPAYSIVVDQPKYEKERYTLMAKYTWTASSDEYLHVGNNVNPSYGYQTIYSVDSAIPVYEEVRVPAVGAMTTTMEYFWAQAFYQEPDGTLWESEINMQTSTTQYVVFSPTESLVSGTLTTTYRTLSSSYTSNGRAYWSLAYNGQCVEDQINISSLNYYEKSVTISDIVFSVRVENGDIKVRSSKTVTCNSTSSNTNGYAAFAVFLD